jgi:hypothetical protein
MNDRILDIILKKIDRIDMKIDKIVDNYVKKEDCNNCFNKKYVAIGTGLGGVISGVLTYYFNKGG